MTQVENYPPHKRRKSDKIVDEIHSQMMAYHKVNDYRMEQIVASIDKLEKVVTENVLTMTELKADLVELKKDSKGVIELHKDLKSTIKIGSAAQKFMFWLLKWGAIGTALYAACSWVFTQVSHLKS